MKKRIWPTCRQVYAGVLYRHRSTVLVADYGRLRDLACERECRWSKVQSFVFLALRPYYLWVVLSVRVRVWLGLGWRG